MADARIFLRMWVLCAFMYCAQSLLRAEVADEPSGASAFTAPCKDVTLSFTQGGRIASVNIKEGDIVEGAQEVVRLDDAWELAELAQLKAEAENRAQIEAREAELNQKQVDLEKYERAAAQNAVSPLEIEHARLDVRIAQIAVRLTQFQHEQSKLKYEAAKIRVEMMRLKSPIGGRVEKIYAREGEAVNAADDVVQIVNIDPLWVDVPVALATAQQLKVGQSATVNFPGGVGGKVQGKIIFIAGVATDPASGTLMVRVETPNEAGRPAGEKVGVVFASSSAESGIGL
jgi:membrane fusion protein, macrolide-specific efflux system